MLLKSMCNPPISSESCYLTNSRTVKVLSISQMMNVVDANLNSLRFLACTVFAKSGENSCIDRVVSNRFI